MQFISNLINQLPFLVLVSLSALFAVLGDFLAKYWSIGHKGWEIVLLTIICYALGGALFIPTLTRQGLVISSTIWSLIEVIGFIFVGVVVFKEQLTSLQGLGVLLGAAALIILSATG